MTDGEVLFGIVVAMVFIWLVFPDKKRPPKIIPFEIIEFVHERPRGNPDLWINIIVFTIVGLVLWVGLHSQ